jgi:hypothetical protein
MVLKDIFAIDSLEDLRQRLDSPAGRQLRGALVREFWKVCRYTSAEKWNRAVRLCEALAIVGWGDCEPVEAWCGETLTGFRNRFDEDRFVLAEWSKRKGGITIRPGDAKYYASPDLPGSTGDFATTICVQNLKLAGQRNWIPKNPIHLYQWLDGSDETTRKLVDSINNQLHPALRRQMNPEAYGTALNQIWIDFYFSSSLPGCSQKFVIIDDDSRMSSVQLHKRLLSMYPASQIKRESMYLRKRFDYGGFQADKGVMKVTIHFAEDFNKLPLPAQKREFAKHLSTAVSGVIPRLADRNLNYDFEKMQHDFEAILRTWAKSRKVSKPGKG